MPRLRRGLSHLFPKHLPGAWRGYPVSKARERNALKRDEFVQRVQDIGELSSREEAERAIKAALETLKQRLAGYGSGQPRRPASRRPRGLAAGRRRTGGLRARRVLPAVRAEGGGQGESGHSLRPGRSPGPAGGRDHRRDGRLSATSSRTSTPSSLVARASKPDRDLTTKLRETARLFERFTFCMTPARLGFFVSTMATANRVQSRRSGHAEMSGQSWAAFCGRSGRCWRTSPPDGYPASLKDTHSTTGG